VLQKKNVENVCCCVCEGHEKCVMMMCGVCVLNVLNEMSCCCELVCAMLTGLWVACSGLKHVGACVSTVCEGNGDEPAAEWLTELCVVKEHVTMC